MAQTVKGRVLILLSAYNGEKYLREQLDSLFALEGGFEITVRVRDDGSSDGTKEILADYAKARGVEVIEGENVGYNKSFFALLDGAEDGYDYYALCDQDDVWLSGKLERAAGMLAGEEGPCLYASALCLADEALSERKPLPPPRRGACFYNAMVQDVCSGHTMVFNNSLLRRIRGSFCEGVFSYDHWIYLIASAFGEVRFDAEPQVLYRQHGDNAVGAGRFSRRLGYLFAGRARAMGAQLLAFWETFGDSLPEKYQSELVRFLQMQKKFFPRIGYAFSGRMYRQSRAESFVFRLLYAFGKFRPKKVCK